MFFRADDIEEVENLLEKAQFPRSSKVQEMYVNFYVMLWKVKSLQGIDSGEEDTEIVILLFFYEIGIN